MAIWERQKGESRKAYAAFCVYRDMGSQRSLAKVAQKLGKSKRLMDRWSKRDGWVQRVNAWDEEQDRLLLEEQREARLEMAQRHARIAVEYQRKILERLQTLEVEKMTARDLAIWLDVATKVERVARGEACEWQKQALPPVAGPVTRDDGSATESAPEPERAATILSILAEAGVIPAPSAEGDGAEADEVHPAPADA